MSSQPIWRRRLRYQHNNVVIVLILANVAVFMLSYLAPVVVRVIAMNPVLTVRNLFLWQPVTYMFAHSSIMHLLFNMLALFFFGTQVERELGSNEFLLFYFLTGTLAGVFSLAVYWFTGAFGVILLGASGAVFAVLFAFAAFYPNAEIYIFGILPIRAAVLVLLYTGIELFSQIVNRRSGIAHLTHLAGFAFAFLYFTVRLGMNPFRRFFR